MKNKIVSIMLSMMVLVAFVPQISFGADGSYDAASPGTTYTESDVNAAGDTVGAESEVQIETEESWESAEATTNSGSNVITGFAELETSDYYYEGNPTLEELTTNLPETMNVYLEGSEELTSIPVSWECAEDYENTDFYFYSMKPAWSEEYTLSENLSEIMDVPWITVYKQEPEEESIEPIMDEEELDPIYTEEEGSIELDDNNESNDSETETEVENTSKISVNGLAFNLLEAVTEDSYAANTSNTEIIYNYLTKTMGLNKAAACGVMTNINAESAMSSTNLQNTYEKSLGLSDSQYTKAVDKGKGAYKTSGGTSKNFKSDAAGYGLCQWTSSGRKTNLLSSALNSSVSIGNINMQLAYLNKELTNSYPQVLATLKQVPNTAAGAYDAAVEFCMCFEIPANTVSTAASRGKACLSGYWATYSGKSASTSGTSYASICGYRYPTAVKKGNGMDVTGYAISNYKITSVVGKITNSSGTTLYSASKSPNTTAYNLNNIDGSMKFAKLSNGTYKYTITVKDSKGGKATATHSFKVSSNGSNGSTTYAYGYAGIGTTSSSGSNETTTDTGTSNKETTTSSDSTKTTYKGTYPTLPKRGYFKKGDSGKQVKRLQVLLNWCGYKVSTGGTYGPKTIAAVKKLQKKLGLKQDGKFGKKTLVKVKKLKR